MKLEFSAVLKELRESPSIQPTKVGRIRELLPDIEIAQRAGVRLADIAIALHNHGFDGMDLKCLQNLLYQARRHKNGRRSIADSSPVPRPQLERKSKSEGIDAESIFEVARKSMSSTQASSLTLDLLRSSTTQKRKLK